MKNKILKVCMITFFVILIYLAQIYLIGDRTLFSVKPNLLLISTLIISLWYGVYKGTIYGFIIGFCTDILYGSSTFVFTISYTLSAMIVGLIHSESRKKSKFLVIYSTLICVATFEISMYVYYAALTGQFSSFFTLIKNIVLSSMLNIIIAYIFHGYSIKFSDKLNLNYRKRGAI